MLSKPGKPLAIHLLLEGKTEPGEASGQSFPNLRSFEDQEGRTCTGANNERAPAPLVLLEIPADAPGVVILVSANLQQQHTFQKRHKFLEVFEHNLGQVGFSGISAATTTTSLTN